MRLEADKLTDVRKCAEVHRQVSCPTSLRPCISLRCVCMLCMRLSAAILHVRYHRRHQLFTPAPPRHATSCIPTMWTTN